MVVGNLQKAREKWAQVLRILVMEGNIFADVGDLLQGSGPGGYPLWVLNVDAEPLHDPDIGRVPENCGLPDDTETTAENN